MLSNNIPKLVDNIINGEINEIGALKQNCKELIDGITISDN